MVLHGRYMLIYELRHITQLKYRMALLIFLNIKFTVANFLTVQ